MTQLYIANLKRQVEHFTFRLNGIDKIHQFPIQPAHQIRIPLPLTDEQIKEIVTQKEVYGLLAAETVVKSTFFAGLCYSLNKPVTGPQIDRGFEHNDAALMQEAEDARVNATAATAATIEEQTEGSLRNFKQEVVEVPRPGQDSENVLNHTVEVQTAEPPVDQAAPSGRRGRRSA